MYPNDPAKLKTRIHRYELDLRTEHQKFGAYDDSYGKRYWLAPLYLLAGDLPGALKSFKWFATAFPDDGGEPYHHLCWALALYRADDLAAATHKLRETMLANLYLIPHLLGQPQPKLDLWHSSNWDEKDYAEAAPHELLALWDLAARQWASATYASPALARARARHMEIFQQLRTEPPGPARGQPGPSAGPATCYTG